MRRLTIGVVVAALLVAACGSPPAGASTRELVVFAAASLGGVLEPLGAAYEASPSGLRLTFAMDSSAALRHQIEQGAPADVFLSADVDNPAAIARSGLGGEPVPFASNALTVIVPLDNPRAVRSPADLARHGVRVVAAAEQVPITRYADRLLARLARLDGYPDGFLRGYEANVVSREDNVRAVVARIELGEGDAAIAYATDALASERVAVVPVPAQANVAATYAAVALDGPETAEAAAFLDWLRGPDAQTILAGAGFLPPP